MPTYSFSRIQTYLKCPLSYKYRYIDKIIPPKEESLDLILWQAVHETLEKLYYEVSNFKLISLEKIINLFKENFDKKIKTAFQ